VKFANQFTEINNEHECARENISTSWPKIDFLMSFKTENLTKSMS